MSEQQSTEQQPLPRKKKKGLLFFLKVLIVFVLLISISLAIAVFYAYHQLSQNGRLEQLIMQKASAATNMDIKFSGYEMSFPGIAIKDLEVATDSAELKLFAKIAEINIRPDLWAAVRGEFIFDTLSIASISARLDLPYVSGKEHAEKDKDAASPPFDPASIRLPFNNFNVDRLNIVVTHGKEKQQRVISLKKAYLNRSILSSSMPFEVEGEIASLARVVASGRLLWPGNVEADINVKTANLSELKQFVPESYQSRFSHFKSGEIIIALKYGLAKKDLNVESISLNLEPGIKASANLVVSGFAPFNASASVSLKPVDLVALAPIYRDFLPKSPSVKVNGGMIGATIDVSIKNSQLDDIKAVLRPEKINLSLAGLPEPLEVSRGSISWQNGGVSFADVSASFSGSKVDLPEGKLVLEPLKFDAKVNLSAELASLFKLARPHLGDDVKAIEPSGNLSFSGRLNYDKAGPTVNGAVKTDKIAVVDSRSKASVSLEDLNLSLTDVGAARGNIEIASLRLNGAGASVAIKGKVINAADLGFDLSAAGNLDVTEFSKLAAGVFKLPVGKDQFKGKISIDMKLGGKMSDLKPAGRLTLENVSADISEKGLLLKNLNGTVNADMDKVLIDKLQADLLGGKISIGGSMTNLKKPVLAANAAITGADLAMIRNLIRKNVPAMPEEIEFSGVGDLSVDLSGNISEPQIKGSAVLKAARFSHPAVMRPVEDINGPISFTNKGLSADKVTAFWGKSKAVISGQMNDWARFVSDFSFQVHPLDVTDAAGFFLKDTGYRVEGTGTGKGTISGPVEKIKVSGTASVANGVAIAPVSQNGEVFRFPYTDLQADFVYFDKVFSVPSAEFAVFRGKIKGSGKVNLESEPFRFEFSSKVENVMTEDFLKENTRMAGALTGGLSGSFSGNGTTAGLASLDGGASLKMASGTYNSPPFIKQISEKLKEPQLASGTISNVSGDYKIQGGRISSNNVMATSSQGKVSFVGSVGLDATLDGEARLQLNRQVCQQNNILRELIGSEEYLDIPVSLKGSMLSPSVGLPLDKMLKDAAERRGKELIQKEAGKLLDKVLGGGKQTTSDGSASQSSPSDAPKVPPVKQIENKVKDLGNELKNLFRRKKK